MKHTPGPWKINQVAGGYNIEIITFKGNTARAHRIARVGAELSEDKKVKNASKENAHLIVAAPEMFETLKTIRDTCHFLCQSMVKKHPEFAKGFDELALLASSGITKAEGGN